MSVFRDKIVEGDLDDFFAKFAANASFPTTESIEAYLDKANSMYSIEEKAWISLRYDSGWDKQAFIDAYNNLLLDVIMSFGYDKRQSLYAVRVYHPSESFTLGGETRFIELVSLASTMFETQPHRKFALILEMEATQVRLFVFHRSGVYHMKPIPIHSEPSVFVRLILCLCFPYDDELLGIDPRIFFKGSDRHIELPMGPNGQFKLCTMDKPEIMLLSRLGTRLWRVRDGDSCMIVKDTWRMESEAQENDFFEAAKGLQGVSQVLRSSDGIKTTDIPGSPRSLKMSVCIFSRTVFEGRGRPLTAFGSKFELLSVLRDAIVGHRELWKKGILHGNITSDGIVIGQTTCKRGSCGLLIDLSRARWVGENRHFPAAVDGWDNVAFQSIMSYYFVPESSFSILAHTYLQDLESFLWIVVNITHNFHGPGNDPLFHPRSNILPWMNPTYHRPELAKNTIRQKSGFLLNSMLSRHLTYYFNGIAFKNLLDSLCSFFTSKYHDKGNVATIDTPWSKVYAQSIKDYDTILGYFECAMQELRIEESRHRLTDTKRKRSAPDFGAALKRRREHE